MIIRSFNYYVWFIASTPSTNAPSITNEVAVIPKPVVSQLPFQNEISRPRYDSVDQPATDSGIEEVNDQTEEVDTNSSILIDITSSYRILLQHVDTT